MSTSHFTPIPTTGAPGIASTWNNPMGELDEAINTHDHNPAVADSGGVIDHSFLSNSGTNSHAAIDSHIGSTNNPHQTSLSQAAAIGGAVPHNQVRADTAEAATNDTLTVNSLLTNNFNRVRYAIAQLSGQPWGTVLNSSLTSHTHNPSIVGDGGMVVQTGIGYDAAEASVPTGQVSSNPSILDNMGHIRYDIAQLKNGVGFAIGSITSVHIQNKALSTDDLADQAVTADILASGAVLPKHLNALRTSARSTTSVKSLVVDIEAGVYFLGDQTAVVAGKQSYSFEGIMPTLTEGSRIDVLYMDGVGQVLRQPGTPGANPSPPDAPDDTLPLVQIYLRGIAATTNAGIYNTNADTGFTPNDSYILRDIRPFLNLGGAGGGGGGSVGSVWEPVIDETPAATPNGSITDFATDDAYIVNTTHVTVEASAGDPIILRRVGTGATPAADEYKENVAGTEVILGAAPASGSKVRVSYFKGTSNPIANMVWQSTPSGTIDSVNDTFTTTDTFVIGSLLVYRADATGDPLVRLIRGVHYNEVDNQTFQFTGGNIPDPGNVLRVQYARSGFATNNADSVDGYHASSTPTANTLLALDSNGQLPTDITGQAVALANSITPASPFYPSVTPTAGQIPVLNSSGNLVLPEKIIMGLAKTIEFTKAAGDTLGNTPYFISGTSGSTTTFSMRIGTGGFNILNNTNGVLLLLSNAGVFSFSGSTLSLTSTSSIAFPQTGGNPDATILNNSNVLRIKSGASGLLIRNNADSVSWLNFNGTSADFGIPVNTGNLGVTGTASVSSTLGVTGAATFSSNVTVSGTLSAQAASGSVAGLMSTSHYTLLSGATSAATASTLMQRDSSANVTVASLIMSTNTNSTSQPYALVARTSSGDGTLRTHNPANVTVGFATTLASGADRTKLDSIDTTSATDANGWRVNYLPNGKRVWTKEWVNQSLTSPTNSPATVLTVTAPTGTTWNNCNVQFSVVSGGVADIYWGFHFGTSGNGNGDGSSGTQGRLHGRTLSGSTLTTYTTAYSLYMVLTER